MAMEARNNNSVIPLTVGILGLAASIGSLMVINNNYLIGRIEVLSAQQAGLDLRIIRLDEALLKLTEKEARDAVLQRPK